MERILKPSRVLIFYINPNSGHHSAALALQEQFLLKYPHVETSVLDFMKYIHPVFAQLLMKTYKGLIKRSPGTWEYLYNNPKVLQTTATIRNLMTRLNLIRIRKVITDFKPHAVVCTQAIPCGALAYYKRKKNMSFPLIGVGTDFATHSYWFHEEVNRYVVPSEKEAIRLESNGLEAHRIRDFGIPIRPKFLQSHDKVLLKEKYGLHEEIFTILIMGGSQGLGRIDKIVKRISRIHAAFQLLIVAGTNKSLLKDLNGYQKKGKYQRYIRVFSHVDYVDELMEIADLIVTKPGGLTCSEAIVKRCPMILVNPLPGQEKQNAEYLSAEKVAISIDEQDELIKILSHILHKPSILQEMLLQQQRILRMDAADRIVDMVMQGDLCNT
jgi:processive 1,2-diacylglycerol beta-glucosyltransferase